LLLLCVHRHLPPSLVPKRFVLPSNHLKTKPHISPQKAFFSCTTGIWVVNGPSLQFASPTPEICSSFKTISKQSHTVLHRKPFFLHHWNLGCKWALSSVCFSNAGEKALCFLTFVFLSIFVSYAITFPE